MQMQHNAVVVVVLVVVGEGGTADECKDVHEKTATRVPVRAQQL